MMNIVGKRFWFLIIAGAYLLFCIISLGYFGLKPGIELTSGSMLTVSFEQTVTEGDLNQELANLGYSNAIVQKTGGGDFIIRTSELSSEAKTNLENGLTTRFGQITEEEFSSVSPLVASETLRNSGIAIGLATVGILLYVAWAFRKMPKPFRYGVCAIIAMAHDAVVALGLFAVLGKTQGWEVDLMFVTGILAIIGYSINDTVVVFDRIRENVTRGISSDFATVVNFSMVETLPRNLNIALAVLFTILALLFFVGASIRSLMVLMLLSVTAGTFSSVFLAPSLLVVWERGEWGRLFRRPLATNRAKGR
jgi:preprotein translocase subunit SecF